MRTSSGNRRHALHRSVPVGWIRAPSARSPGRPTPHRADGRRRQHRLGDPRLPRPRSADTRPDDVPGVRLGRAGTAAVLGQVLPRLVPDAPRRTEPRAPRARPPRGRGHGPAPGHAERRRAPRTGGEPRTLCAPRPDRRRGLPGVWAAYPAGRAPGADGPAQPGVRRPPCGRRAPPGRRRGARRHRRLPGPRLRLVRGDAQARRGLLRRERPQAPCAALLRRGRGVRRTAGGGVVADRALGLPLRPARPRARCTRGDRESRYDPR